MDNKDVEKANDDNETKKKSLLIIARERKMVIMR